MLPCRKAAARQPSAALEAFAVTAPTLEAFAGTAPSHASIFRNLGDDRIIEIMETIDYFHNRKIDSILMELVHLSPFDYI